MTKKEIAVYLKVIDTFRKDKEIDRSVIWSYLVDVTDLADGNFQIEFCVHFDKRAGSRSVNTIIKHFSSFSYCTIEIDRVYNVANFHFQTIGVN